MKHNEAVTPTTLSAALSRGSVLYLLWLVLMQSVKPGDLIMGLLTTVAATWVSLHLFKPESGRFRYGKLLALFPHFIWVSVLAGFDVARRAFDPRLPLQPGFVRCPLDFPPGLARNTFATFTSLMPGTVPIGETDEDLIYHCLDTSQPVVEQLWREERLLATAVDIGRHHE
ncbi:MAG: Na+/H+ antiporter subunit E [Arenimonas sp.]|nr:Na+/H+ antiporter subunit E [Arenimonas sp.]